MIYLIIVIVIIIAILFFSITMCYLKKIKAKNDEIIELKKSVKYYKDELKKRTNEDFDDYLHLKHKKV